MLGDWSLTILIVVVNEENATLKVMKKTHLTKYTTPLLIFGENVELQNAIQDFGDRGNPCFLVFKSFIY